MGYYDFVTRGDSNGVDNKSFVYTYAEAIAHYEYHMGNRIGDKQQGLLPQNWDDLTGEQKERYFDELSTAYETCIEYAQDDMDDQASHIIDTMLEEKQSESN